MVRSPGASRPAPPLAAPDARRFGARVLDRPTRPPTQTEPGSQPSAYVGHCLLVSGRPGGRRAQVLERLRASAAAAHLRVEVDERLDHVAEQLAGVDPVAEGIVDRLWVSTVHLTPTLSSQAAPREPVDAWPVLRRLRAEGLSAADVRLDHPAFACPAPAGLPGPDAGGRRPVSLILPDPAAGSTRRRRRRPVVVVPDTGIGAHPWFGEESQVTRAVVVAGVRLGLGGPMDVGRPEPRNPLDGAVARYAGHGTFIAGIIRQQCPQARIESVPVMDDDGGVNERLLLNTLVALLVRQAVAVTRGTAADLLDVLSLSLGYYHEEPGDEQTDPILAGVLRELGSWGVIVVASAGNDGTTAPFHPASFAGQVTGLRPDTVPLLSVGALNPNGTVAHFSNAGPWVTCDRLGVEVVSTVPITVEGTDQPAEHGEHRGTARSALDPDDFSGGFGTWTGTSFAAPLLAGQLLTRLARSRSIDLTDRAAAVRRGWAAVRQEVPDLS